MRSGHQLRPGTNESVWWKSCRLENEEDDWLRCPWQVSGRSSSDHRPLRLQVRSRAEQNFQTFSLVSIFFFAVCTVTTVDLLCFFGDSSCQHGSHVFFLKIFFLCDVCCSPRCSHVSRSIALHIVLLRKMMINLWCSERILRWPEWNRTTSRFRKYDFLPQKK